MKKLAFFIAGLLIFINLNAQNPDTSYWEIGGISNIAFNQTNFKYWSAYLTVNFRFILRH